MWELPGPGREPVSPALAGGFLTTAPPGKSLDNVFWCTKFKIFHDIHCSVFLLLPVPRNHCRIQGCEDSNLRKHGVGLFCLLVCVCLHASITLFWAPKHCSSFEIRKCAFQLCFFSRLLWLFGISWHSIWILGCFLLFLKKCHWNFHRDCIESIDCFV